ncbi:hypothetical protein KPG66_11845 [Mycetohabitans sp. B2]|uniref:hypothetical protein n=1 Tax=Mycetohabitans sp. B2 TaxID=2841274 RepID=UPI001F3DD5F6|nr:hypothetical protein [Mycetohabitans sp. B2]MCF7696758.1 hypothetical protein [Mycetohabitans sp. B2]
MRTFRDGAHGFTGGQSEVAAVFHDHEAIGQITRDAACQDPRHLLERRALADRFGNW